MALPLQARYRGRRMHDSNAPRDYPALRAFLRWPQDAPLDGPRTSAHTNVSAAPPTVRRSAPARKAAPLQKPALLGDAARAALFFQPEPDHASFDIALDERLLGQVRCRISLGPEGIDATFVVVHATERWLLDAQAPRLRQMLVERGLKVRQVRVMDADDPEAPQLLT